MTPLLALLFVSAAVASADDHAHGFEWAGLFELDAGEYTWTAAKVGGEYADASMKIAFVPTSGHDTDAIEAVEESNAVEAMESDACVAVNPGTTLYPDATSCYQLVFDDTIYFSLWKLVISSETDLAIFCEHYPTEFEFDSHFLKDASGNDVEPEAVEGEGETSGSSSDSSVNWGATMGACMIVLLTTFAGILFMAPKCLAAVGDNVNTFIRLACAFASGSILSCACFLMWLESSHYIAANYDEEVDVTWRWGVSILSGFLLAVVNDVIVQFLSPERAATNGAATNGAEAANGTVVTKADADIQVVVDGADATGADATKINRSTCLAVLVGDGFHNVVDGIFIGAAFAGCNPAFGWTVAMSTVAHELSQELADFFVLIGPGGLKAPQALLVNFISQLGVVVGGLVFCASEPSSEAIGVMLAFGGGVYMYIGATECGGHMMKSEGSTPKLALACVGLFILGAIVIGLVLLDHDHCEAEDDDGGDGGHDGHGH